MTLSPSCAAPSVCDSIGFKHNPRNLGFQQRLLVVNHFGFQSLLVYPLNRPSIGQQRFLDALFQTLELALRVCEPSQSTRFGAASD